MRRRERDLWTIAILGGIAGAANHAAVWAWHWPDIADWHAALYASAATLAAHAAYWRGRRHGRRDA